MQIKRIGVGLEELTGETEEGVIVDLGVWVEEFKIDIYEGLLGRKRLVSCLIGWLGRGRTASSESESLSSLVAFCFRFDIRFSTNPSLHGGHVPQLSV
jgi:hypothetical protein